jgi:hypothetical protein
MHVAYFDDVSWADGQESKIPETLPFVPFAIFGQPAGDDRKAQSAVLAFAIFLLQYQYRNGPSLFQVLPGGMYFWKRQVSDRR